MREREMMMMISLKEEEEDSAKLKRSSSNPICLLKVGPLLSSSSLSSRLLLNRICKTEKSYTCIAKHNHRHDHERKTKKQKTQRDISFSHRHHDHISFLFFFLLLPAAAAYEPLFFLPELKIYSQNAILKIESTKIK
jgi:hypothetical protein